MRPPICCDEVTAKEYLCISQGMWEKLRARRIIKALCKGWYAYADLDAAIETLRNERDQDKIIDYEKASRQRKKTRSVGSQGSEPGYGTPQEFLR